MTGYSLRTPSSASWSWSACGFFVGAIAANRLLRPGRAAREKLLTYECGRGPRRRRLGQTQVRYYVFAYLYVVFAVDAVYLFPWATVFADAWVRRRDARSRWACSSASRGRAAVRLAHAGC